VEKRRWMALKRRLQRTNKDQYTVTVPKALVELLRLQEQDELEFGLKGGTITLRKGRQRGGRHG
jgi:bifunctional DNA-binding transcriptional regulator/antitoxin component of YhaV-PrlF toxin-antitoxin module